MTTRLQIDEDEENASAFPSIERRMPLRSATVTRIWRNAKAVCFDVDSTVCSEESIDVLAELAGVGPEVKHVTSLGMDGAMTFQDSLRQRLNIIRPSLSLIDRYLAECPPQLSPNVASLVTALSARNLPVYLVSGGFRQVIRGVATSLGLHPEENVFAVELLFDSAGEYAGFDGTELTSRSGGKAEVVAFLKEKYGYDLVVHIGDGATDLEARPPADLIVGYGGIVRRPIMEEHADWFVTNFSDLLDLERSVFPA